MNQRKATSSHQEVNKTNHNRQYKSHEPKRSYQLTPRGKHKQTITDNTKAMNQRKATSSHQEVKQTNHNRQYKSHEPKESYQLTPRGKTNKP